MSVSEAFRGVVDESVQVNVSQAFNGTTLRSFMPLARRWLRHRTRNLA